jgi:hypothetical protein
MYIYSNLFFNVLNIEYKMTDLQEIKYMMLNPC